MGMKPLFWRHNSINRKHQPKHKNTQLPALGFRQIELFKIKRWWLRYTNDKVHIKIIMFWWWCVGSIMCWVHIQRIIQILPSAVVKSYKPLGGTNLCLCIWRQWWEYWISEFWAVQNVSEISCDPGSAVYQQQNNAQSMWATLGQYSTVSFGRWRSLLAFVEHCVPEGRARFYHQVLIWTRYVCTNMNNISTTQCQTCNAKYDHT